MEVISDAQISFFVQQYVLPFIRISSLFMTMPVMGARVVPARVRVVTAVLCSFIVIPILPPLPDVPSLSVQALLLVAQEIMIGVAIGFSFQVVFQVFVLTGQYLSMQLGLGFAAMNDPTSGVSTTVLSQFYLVMATLLFLSINGHLILFEMVIESFSALPPGQFHFTPEQAQKIAYLGSWMFASALIISLPVLASLLVVNIAFGVMSRAAPQLNIFAIGFPFTLICGIALVWLGVMALGVHFDHVIESGFEFVRSFVFVK
jgi:flagellar biosynthesis protein FliR